MTIVSENNVSTALHYLAEHPHPFARARKALTDAENEYEQIWATVYGEQTGPVKDKEAATDRDQRAIAARKCIAEAQFDLEAHRRRIACSEMLIEVWRSENANARTAERVR